MELWRCHHIARIAYVSPPCDASMCREHSANPDSFDGRHRLALRVARGTGVAEARTAQRRPRPAQAMALCVPRNRRRGVQRRPRAVAFVGILNVGDKRNVEERFRPSTSSICPEGRVAAVFFGHCDVWAPFAKRCLGRCS